MDGKAPPIIRRRLNLSFNLNGEGRWSRRQAYYEDFLDAFSYDFPVAETFFVDSAMAYRDRISDPELLQQLKDFAYQEAKHTKMHVRGNELLDQTHPHGKRLAKISAFTFGLFGLLPAPTRLAVTCAYEHFTAMLANYLLTNMKLFMFLSDPTYGALWGWHAVEETEHKAVCVDVYQHVFGKGVLSYLHRVFVMVLVTAIIVPKLLVMTLLINRGRRRYTRSNQIPAEGFEQKAKTAKNHQPYPLPPPPEYDEIVHLIPLKAHPTLDSTVMRQLWALIIEAVQPGLYFSYYRPSFHPWEHDNSALISEWKECYPGFGISTDAAGDEKQAPAKA